MDTIVLHPTYFPNIAQMVAVAQTKTVLFEAHDNYQKQTYRNRMYIAHSNGKLSLNIPVKHGVKGERQKSAEVLVENNFNWQRDHWRSIQNAYRTSPFFEFYEDDIAPLFLTPANKLYELNLASFNLICDLIGLSPELDFTGSYSAQYKTELDLRPLANFKKTARFNCQPYTQVLEASHGFLNNLSVLDLLFNEGPASLSYLENHPHAFSPSQ